MTDNANEPTQANTEIDCGILLVHLVSGEDIVGHVYVREEGVKIEHPIVPQVRADAAGRLQIGAGPLRPFLKEMPITVSGQHVLYMAPVSDEMAAFHQQVTGRITLATTTPSSKIQL